MKVRVIMPVYNGERFIACAIKSIINQTFVDWELIIVDDGSSDKTVDIIDTFSDKRIKLIRQTNSGPEAARQAGFVGCDSNYVARMDADDEMSSDRLQIQVDFLDENPDIVAVGGQIMYLSEDSSRKGFPSCWPLSHSQIIKNFFSMKSGICNATVMCRRTAQENIKPTVHGGPGADVGFVLALAKQGRVANLPTVIHYVRIHNDSIQSSYDPKKRIMRARYSLECAKCSFNENPAPSWEDFALRWSARSVFSNLIDSHDAYVAKIARGAMWYKLNSPFSPKVYIMMAFASVIAPIRTAKKILKYFF